MQHRSVDFDATEAQSKRSTSQSCVSQILCQFVLEAFFDMLPVYKPIILAQVSPSKTSLQLSRATPAGLTAQPVLYLQISDYNVGLRSLNFDYSMVKGKMHWSIAMISLALHVISFSIILIICPLFMLSV